MLSSCIAISLDCVNAEIHHVWARSSMSRGTPCANAGLINTLLQRGVGLTPADSEPLQRFPLRLRLRRVGRREKLVPAPPVIVIWRWIILPRFANATPIHFQVLRVSIDETQHVERVFKSIC